MENYRASLIGCGRVAWMLEDDPLDVKPCTHMGAYLSISGEKNKIKVVAASDTDRGRLEAFGRRFGACALYGDYREMLRRESPDIVSICTYATDRHRMVMDSIEAGVRGIWCEKAFATSLNEARHMADACAKNGVSLIVSHMRRWSGNYRKAKEMIEKGMIGRLQSMVSHFSGSLIHTGTHAFDVLLWFAGRADWVEGWLEGEGGSQAWDTAEDLGGRAFIKFENGVYATVHAESKGYFFFEFDIIGSHGRIRIGNNEVLEYHLPKESRHYTGLKELHAEPFPGYENKNPWTGALENLIGCMEGREDNLNGPQDGYKSLEAALAIHESSKRGGQRIYLPLKESDFKVRSR